MTDFFVFVLNTSEITSGNALEYILLFTQTHVRKFQRGAEAEVGS